MSLEQLINNDIKTAMRAKDKGRLRALRAVKSQLLLAKTAEGGSDTMDKATEIKMLSKMIKQRKDSLEIYNQQDRADLAEKEEEEIKHIIEYLPKQLSTEDLTVAIQKIIADTGASSMRDMGKVMGMASKQFAGKADGKTISGIVKKLLLS
ncbi:MAG: GatB/YqeY domain-containing protein [Chitinophagales bacterium]